MVGMAVSEMEEGATPRLLARDWGRLDCDLMDSSVAAAVALPWVVTTRVAYQKGVYARHQQVQQPSAAASVAACMALGGGQARGISMKRGSMT